MLSLHFDFSVEPGEDDPIQHLSPFGFSTVYQGGTQLSLAFSDVSLGTPSGRASRETNGA